MALRIAFVVDRFGRRYGGAEAYGVELMRELAARHDITVFAREYDAQCDVRLNWVRLRRWHRWPSWLRVLFNARQAARETRSGFDVVHSHSNGWAGDVEVVHVTPVRYNRFFRPMPFMRRLGALFSLRLHTYMQLEKRRLARRAGHQVVAVSPLIRAQLHQAYGADLPVEIIPPGVALPPRPDAGRRGAGRAALQLAHDEVVAILVARNPLRKGLLTALEAWLMLPEHYRLLVVGGEPPVLKAIRKMPASQALGERLLLMPATSDVTPYFQAADLCIHPTLNDSFGMVPLEAMSFGLPVVLSRAPYCGFAAYLRPDADALILDDPQDAQALAQAVRAVSEHPERHAALAAAGLQVAGRHSWSKVAKCYEQLYQNIQAQRTGTATSDPSA